MSASLAKLQSEAKRLSNEEKLELAHSIWQDLQETSPESESFWKTEMDRRYKKIKSGEAQLISLEDFQAKHAYLEKDIP